MFIKHSALAGIVLLAASESANAVVINFDYSFDGGFFAGESNSIRRSTLNAAGAYLGNILSDNLAPIASTGTNQFGAIFQRPDNGTEIKLTNFNVAADTLTVFVGGRTLGGNTLGLGGHGGYDASGDATFLNTIQSRGQSGATSGASASDYAPWGGQLTFSNTANWYFDEPPSSNESFSGNDFYSVALHELGHLLGLGSAASWINKISGANFNGANAVASNGGHAVALADDKAHWAEGTLSNVNGIPQEALLDPTLQVGSRKVFTQLDLAALKDVGWQVNITAVPVPSAIWLFGSALLGVAGFNRKKIPAA